MDDEIVFDEPEEIVDEIPVENSGVEYAQPIVQNNSNNRMIDDLKSIHDANQAIRNRVDSGRHTNQMPTNNSLNNPNNSLKNNNGLDNKNNNLNKSNSNSSLSKSDSSNSNNKLSNGQNMKNNLMEQAITKYAKSKGVPEWVTKMAMNRNRAKKLPGIPATPSPIGAATKNQGIGSKKETEERSSDGGIFNVVISAKVLKIIGIAGGAVALFMIMFICLTSASQTYINAKKLHQAYSSEEMENFMNNKMTEKQKNDEITDEDLKKLDGYNYTDTNLVSVARKAEKFSTTDLNELDDFYSVINNYNNIDESIVYKFFFKLDFIKKYYRAKYNVEIDLPLLMSTLILQSDDMKDVFESNTKGFSYTGCRKKVNGVYNYEACWDPTKGNENLRPMKYFKYDYNWDSYKIKYNDSKHDIERLVQHMISAQATERCYDSDGSIVSENVLRDSNVDSQVLVCNPGETYSKTGATYELDDDKYKEYLREFLEKKYYLDDNSPYVDIEGEDDVIDEIPDLPQSGDSSFGSAIISLAERELAGVNTYGYKYKNAFGSSGPWCAMFVWWLSANTTVNGVTVYPNKVTLKSASTGAYMKYFLNNNDNIHFYYNDNCSYYKNKNGKGITYSPKPGDYVFIDWGAKKWTKTSDTQDHTAIVRSYSNGTLQTIEGNVTAGPGTQPAVRSFKYSINDCRIIGFGSWY